MLIAKFDNTNIVTQIGDFEKKYDFTYPNKYRNFLIKYNGGRTLETKFKLNKVSSDICGFYGFGKAELTYTFYEENDLIPEYIDDDVIPIAENSFGDSILIGVGADNNEKVYFLYHDRPVKYIELSSDFKEFISKCKSKKSKPVRSIEERRSALIADGLESIITDQLVGMWQEEIDTYNVEQEEVILQ